ncbi:MAG: hypothetical protein BRC25_00340 [Parcubacteria group bacterium SW_6_46_9]|nr:MAG: hypothetical protein BRC25_00340 [Parcubacteria group bacterium SW_6_46_9]
MDVNPDANKQYAKTVAIIIGVVFVVISVVVALIISTGRTAAQEDTSDTSSLAEVFSFGLTSDKHDNQSTEDIIADSRCTQMILNQNLSRGDRSQAVADLQRFLNADVDTQVAETGPGSPGNEISVYNQNTTQAVTQFQEKYLGSVSGKPGVWGGQERQQARELCSTEGNRTSIEDYRDLEDNLSDEELSGYIDKRDRLFGGEAVLTDFELNGWGRIRAGETQNVADIAFDVAGGDVLVDRVNLSFVPTGEGNNRPWAVFDSVTIYNNREKVASIDADKKYNWIDGGLNYGEPRAGSKAFTLRLDGLNQIVKQNNRADLSVWITTKDTVYPGSMSWSMFVGDDGVHVVDAKGIRQSIGDRTQARTFDVDYSRDTDRNGQIAVEQSYWNPESSAIPVQANTISDPFSVFAFVLDADEIPETLDRVTVRVDIKGQAETPQFQDVVDQGVLVIGDSTYAVESITPVSQSGNYRSYNLTFRPDNFTIDDYSSETTRLVLRFSQTAGNYNQGTALRAVVTPGSIQAENDAENKTGTPGPWHVLRLQ